MFVSFDGGGHWRPLQLDLPVTPIHDLVVKGDDLVAATHGRAFWILDDLTPLRQASTATADAALWLYAPEQATRLYYPDQVDNRRPVGENPPAGALIDYVLKAKPTQEVTLDIVDAQGKSIRHISSLYSAREKQPPEWPDQVEPPHLIPVDAGMNRFVWDLRMDDPAQIPGAFYSGEAPRGPLAAPGTYQVRLTMGGVSRTAPLVLVADPRASVDPSALRAKTELAMATVNDIDALHRAVNDIRAAETKLSQPGDAAMKARLYAVEQALIQVNMKGSEANLAFPGMLNEQYATFAAILEDADTAPTSQETQRFASLHAQLGVQLTAWGALKSQMDPTAAKPT